jgi:hypothetical protein
LRRAYYDGHRRLFGQFCERPCRADLTGGGVVLAQVAGHPAQQQRPAVGPRAEQTTVNTAGAGAPTSA